MPNKININSGTVLIGNIPAVEIIEGEMRILVQCPSNGAADNLATGLRSLFLKYTSYVEELVCPKCGNDLIKKSEYEKRQAVKHKECEKKDRIYCPRLGACSVRTK